VAALLGLGLGGCANTAAALAAMPEGYWEATERLLLAVGEDAWAILRPVLELLLPL
jgi:hypothetical protein